MCRSHPMRRSTPEGGPMYIRNAVNCIDALGLLEEELEELYYKNACTLMGLQ